MLEFFLASGRVSPSASLLGSHPSAKRSRAESTSANLSRAPFARPTIPPPGSSTFVGTQAALCTISDLATGALNLGFSQNHRELGNVADPNTKIASIVMGLNRYQCQLLAASNNDKFLGDPGALCPGPSLVLLSGLPGSGRTTALSAAALTQVTKHTAATEPHGSSLRVGDGSGATHSHCGDGSALFVGPQHAALLSAADALDSALAGPGGGGDGSESVCICLSHDDDARVVNQINDLLASLALAYKPEVIHHLLKRQRG